MNMIVPRDYQLRACREINTAWAGGMRRPAVVLPTGAGKTVTFCELIRQWLNDVANGGRRAVVLVHREELAQQAVDKIRVILPDASVGMVKASRNEVHADIVVCSTQTLARPGRVEQVKGVGLVVVDEAHHYASKEWKGVLARLRCFASDGPVTAGFTATMSRSDDQGLGAVWDDVVYQRGIMRMIMDGHLCDVKPLSVEVDGLDLGRVARKFGGEFRDASLSEALEASGAHTAIATAYAAHAVRTIEGVVDGVRQGVVFAPTVRFAELVCGALEGIGVSAAVISGKTSVEDRVLIYKRYREGDVRVLCNCMVLTEGWDAPWAEVAVIARPTQSGGLYTQMVGRVLRTHPGKRDALVLDVCGATRDNSLCGLVDLSEEIVPPLPGETLTQALERVREEARVSGGRIPLGNMSVREVDMFKRVQGNWLQTTGNVWFNRTRDHTYFIWPVKDGDTYTVGRFDNKGSLKSTGVWMTDGRWTRVKSRDATSYPMDFALALGDGEAMEDDPSIGGKDAPWRKRRRPPTDKQCEYARGLGIVFDGGVTRGGLSQLISTLVVSKALHGRR